MKEEGGGDDSRIPFLFLLDHGHDSMRLGMDFDFPFEELLSRNEMSFNC